MVHVNAQWFAILRNNQVRLNEVVEFVSDCNSIRSVIQRNMNNNYYQTYEGYDGLNDWVLIFNRQIGVSGMLWYGNERFSNVSEKKSRRLEFWLKT